MDHSTDSEPAFAALARRTVLALSLPVALGLAGESPVGRAIAIASAFGLDVIATSSLTWTGLIARSRHLTFFYAFFIPVFGVPAAVSLAAVPQSEATWGALWLLVACLSVVLASRIRGHWIEPRLSDTPFVVAGIGLGLILSPINIVPALAAGLFALVTLGYTRSLIRTLVA